MPDAPPSQPSFRDWVALAIIIASCGGVVALAVAAVLIKPENAQTVMGTVLPLLGSWVGTVLAYYFSKENFEAATRSVSQMAKQLSPQERLQSLKVKDEMIATANLFSKTMPAEAINLVTALAELKNANKGNRIPVFDAAGLPVYIIHRSMIDKYLAEKAQADPPVPLPPLTLANLLADSPDLKLMFESFETVKETATLADAKKAMEATRDCQDVFVTEDGTKTKPVLGLITNVIIEKRLRV